MGPAVFVTGGAGFVGSHCIVELLNSGFEVIAVDNFANATPGKQEEKPKCIQVVEELTGKTITFYKADLLEKHSIEKVFEKHDIYCVIHFAALKAVGESMKIPLDYYRNNVGGTINLLEIMKKFGVHKMIFSSSATVYGKPQYLPIDEKHPTGIDVTNPYGRTKYFIEEILKDVTLSEKDWSTLLLRYFNPVGAHPSGKMGESPQGTPNNLMPYISQVAVGRRKELQVYGNDFQTPDGTGVRDYIHVMDLAKGHVAALNKMLENGILGCKVYNLGTGCGNTVLEVIKAFEKASNVKVNHSIVGRRDGDLDCLYADCSLAAKELSWKAELSLNDMCRDTWRWQSNNPSGFN